MVSRKLSNGIRPTQATPTPSPNGGTDLSHTPIDNTTFLQGFEWYLPTDQAHWVRLASLFPQLKSMGIDTVWIPPGCKAGWHASNGYDVYDLYDLGEFNQKGSIGTKWGLKSDLVEMMQKAKECKIGVLWDAVLNHKAAADYVEKCQAIKVDKEDRRKELGGVHEVEVWTGYDFAGRKGKHSSLKYNWHHFSGTDWDAGRQSNDSIYKFVKDDKSGWAEDVDDSLGNFDYLMANDIDYSHPSVRADVLHWGEWIVNTLGISGFRLDAIKHFSRTFLKEWIDHLDSKSDRSLFFVGEYWRGDLDVLGPFIEAFHGRLALFDVTLAGNMSTLSRAEKGDLRLLLKNTLMENYPDQAVTFVQNHDTQDRHERFEEVSPVESWFIPIAYALILFHISSKKPCVFYGDIYGIQGPKPKHPSCHGKLPLMVRARKMYAYGEQLDYLDSAECIGFTRLGHAEKAGGAAVAVVMNIGCEYSSLSMFVGQKHVGEEWTDLFKWAWGTVKIDENGFGVFPVGPKSVGVWLQSKAVGRHELESMPPVTVKSADNLFNGLAASHL